MRLARRAASSPRRSTAARRRAREWRSDLRSASRPFRANNNKISLLCERESERTNDSEYTTNFQLEIYSVDVAPSSSTSLSFPKKRSTRGTPLFVGRVLSSTQKPPRCPSLSLSTTTTTVLLLVVALFSSLGEIRDSGCVTLSRVRNECVFFSPFFLSRFCCVPYYS